MSTSNENLLTNLIKKHRIEVFGFSGKAGAGKDFLAQALNVMLVDTKTVFLALADILKYNGIVQKGLNHVKVFGLKDEATRITLQKLGTEEGRDIYGKDIWIKYLREIIRQHISRGMRRIFITDVRFEEEVYFVSSELLGKLFRIIAPLRTNAKLLAELNLTYESQGKVLTVTDEVKEKINKIANHPSEVALDSPEFIKYYDLILHNNPDDKALDLLRDYALTFLTRDEYVFFVDLDDTICYCHRYYHEAFDKMIKLLRELFPTITKLPEYYTLFDKEWFLQPVHRENFAKKLVDCARKTAPYISDMDSSKIFEFGMQVHQQDFPEIPKAVEAVKLLSTMGKVVVFTLGDKIDQGRKIAKLGLAETIYALESSCSKDPGMFKYLKHKYPARNWFMFGDSFIRDINPALEAGEINVFHIQTEMKDTDDTAINQTYRYYSLYDAALIIIK